MKRIITFIVTLVMLPLVSCTPMEGTGSAVAVQETQRPAFRGVVSSADPRATAAGQEILRKGGSAADAAMAMMLTLTVVEPQSSGIGGGGFLLFHDTKSGKITTIDGRETAPASADERRFVGADGKPMRFIDAFQGGHSVGVPGNMRLMEQTHRRWGKLPWADIFVPAIRHAEQGYEVNAVLQSRLGRLRKIWANFPEARKIYWQDGRPKRRGETVRNPDLARLLRHVAENGADAFYTGKAGQGIIAALANAKVNPAVITQADLSAYRVVPRDAVCLPYRGYKVCGMGPPSSGATTVLQILGTLRPFDMGALGKDNPQSWHLISEAMQLAYADRAKYLGDPGFVNVPVKGMLSDGYLASRSALVSADSSLGTYEAGTPPGSEKRTVARSSEVAGTTHFVAVDSQGNVASMTSTVEGAFGSQLIANGFFLNNELTDFTFAPEKDGAPVANRVQPGKRPLSSMSPTIVYDASGQPVLALGSAGGKRIIMHVTKTLIGVLDFGLPLQDAIALPNIYYGGDAVLVEKGSYLAAMAGDLSRYGQTVLTTNLPSKVNGAQWVEDRWVGAADPRSPGVALTE
ncbi:gamma-glutamyltransferase [Sphingorhabdus sp. Alg239-R122]|uniref:gamma-glutamyltransferase n=1 Tax=Sphingorhabdus sp. Alg239-R122 TaxID=2305989 RepID=UPI001F072645|nr:gamma-glutamyltransferase [Sphingorhabdus sp. Alg239-R122]